MGELGSSPRAGHPSAGCMEVAQCVSRLDPAPARWLAGSQMRRASKLFPKLLVTTGLPSQTRSSSKVGKSCSIFVKGTGLLLRGTSSSSSAVQMYGCHDPFLTMLPSPHHSEGDHRPRVRAGSGCRSCWILRGGELRLYPFLSLGDGGISIRHPDQAWVLVRECHEDHPAQATPAKAYLVTLVLHKVGFLKVMGISHSWDGRSWLSTGIHQAVVSALCLDWPIYGGPGR